MLRHHLPTVLKTANLGLELGPHTSDAVSPPRILIIEDELLIALVIEEMCLEAGYQVTGVAHTFEMARDKIAKRNFEAVLLDVSIGGRYDPKIADFLTAKSIPFAFVTGYDYLVDPGHEKVPVLQKPFTQSQLGALLETLAGPSPSSGKMSQTA